MIENNKNIKVTNSYLSTLKNNNLVEVNNSLIDTIKENKGKVKLNNVYAKTLHNNMNTTIINSKIEKVEDNPVPTNKMIDDIFEAISSEVTGRVYMIDDVAFKDSKISSVGMAKNLNSTNSDIMLVEFIDDFAATNGSINHIRNTKNINLKGTATNKIILNNIEFIDEGIIDHAVIDNIRFAGSDYDSRIPKFVTISNSLIKASKKESNDNYANNFKLHNTEVQGVMTKYLNLEAYASKFKNNINTRSLILDENENGKRSEFNSSNTIRTKNYKINKLDTGKEYNISGDIIGEGSISNSLINMQISGLSDKELHSEKYLKELIVTAATFYGSLDDSNVTLDNVVATNNARAGVLNVNNSKLAKRVLAKSLVSNNTAYYLGANKESYTGAITSRENTSGANNELVLLNIMNDKKFDTSKINANLPLAILKKGTGNAELNTFFKDYKISDGISDYVINNDYIARAMVGDYLTYAITTTKNGKVSDTGLNESNIASIANGDKTTTLGKLVNNSASDRDSEVLDDYLNNLASNNYVSNVILPNENDKTPTNPDTNGNAGNENTTLNNGGENSSINNGENSSSNGNSNENTNTNLPNIDNKPNTGSNIGNTSTGNTNTGNTNNNENTNSNNNSVKPILADDFIKSIKLNDKVKSQANVLAKGVNFIHNLEWNNVNKRLGEIRNLDADTGVWARLYHTNASVLDEVNLNSLELQFGADKQSEVSNAKIYSGVVGSVSKAKADDNILKSTGFGVGLYVSAVADNGYYADLVAKVNRYKMTFNAATLDEIKENKTGFLASLELGKRFDVNNFYLEPSVEAIVDYTPSLKLENDKILIKTKSSTNLHLKPALAAGLNLNDNANLRLGAGYIIDVNKPKNATITAKNSKVKEVIKGERDNKFYINLGGSYKINDNLRLNLGYERTFSADYNIDHQINAVVRYTF